MNPTLILTADWHLRGDVPKARLDKQTYHHTQAAKRDYIIALAMKCECPILVAGDVGHKPEWPNWLLTSLIGVLSAHKVRVLVVPGQHDLPEHRLDQWQNSGLGVLEASGAVEVLVEPLNSVVIDGIQIDTAPFGEEPPEFDDSNEAQRHVLCCHRLISDKKADPNGGVFVDSFIKHHQQYDLILCGDNHKTFAKKYRDTLFLSPGSLMRMSADQIDHKPAVFLWYAETNLLRPVYLPIQADVVSREHIETKKAKEERLSAFVERMKGTGEQKLQFEKNLEGRMEEANASPRVRGKVNTVLKG